MKLTHSLIACFLIIKNNPTWIKTINKDNPQANKNDTFENAQSLIVIIDLNKNKVIIVPSVTGTKYIKAICIDIIDFILVFLTPRNVIFLYTDLSCHIVFNILSPIVIIAETKAIVEIYRVSNK